MRAILTTATLTILIGSTLGCDRAGNAGEGQPTAQAPATTSPQHAPATAVPGSYEDWCGGHQVPESMCTRCNPSLIPAFQATGDWCQEHGLPESQCLKCNPNLEIKRPPKAAGS